MSPSPTIVWFRLDLRTADHPSLSTAVDQGAPVIPLFIWSPDEEGEWGPGQASMWWLHQSLKSLDQDLREKGSRLVIRKGKALEVLRDVIRESGADAVYWHRRYEPEVIRRDQGVKSALKDFGVEARDFKGALLFEPGEVASKSGNPYRVFTPFWRACREEGEAEAPLPKPGKIPAPIHCPPSLPLEELRLQPKIAWAEGIARAWNPGEKGAWKEFSRFLDQAMHTYDEERNRPDRNGTSRLSPHLHFGEISPRSIRYAVEEQAVATSRFGVVKGSEVYLSEIGWREFAHHLLYHFPHTTNEPLREGFKAFPWRKNNRLRNAWQIGKTGYPIVDAGMRQLWETGWMHNRVRMIAASFLVKDLLIRWQDGAEWFWDTLVDADLASNTLGWQWTAGCGADAAPYFRIFNPVSQGVKFDPEGEYVSRFVPELRKMPAKYIHQPWKAPAAVLNNADVELGKDYPHPIVDHKEARDEALLAYSEI